MSTKGGEPTFGRRQLLRGAVWLGGAALVRPIASALAESDRYNKLTEEEKFKEGGLGDFFLLYNELSKGISWYRVMPEFYYIKGAYYGNLYNILDRYNNGIHNGNKTDSHLISRVNDDWGSGLGERSKLVNGKIKSLEISIVEGAPDKKEDVRTAYARLGAIFPAYVLMAPDRLVINNGGGHINLASKNPDIAIESPARDLEGFFRTGLHELAHTETNWIVGKPYVDKKAYINYQIARVKSCFSVFEKCYGGSWQESMEFKEGAPLLTVWAGEQSMESMERLERNLLDKYGVDVTKYQLDEEKMGDISYRYNRYVYAAIHQVISTLLGKTYDDQTWPERNYISNVYNPLAMRVMGEIDHYLVGPIQRAFGGLVGKNHPPDKPESFLTKVNERLNLERWRAYSTLNKSELVDFPTANAALRRRLGLGED